MENKTVSRLRRAISDADDFELRKGSLALIEEQLARLPPDQALVYERAVGWYAQAAEELGPNASAQEIGRLARAIAARPN